MKKYVFCHDFLPVVFKDKLEIVDNWRYSSNDVWSDAHWLNGQAIVLYNNLVLKDKIIICGHVGSSYSHKLINHHEDYSKNLIAINSTIYKTNLVNVLVISDELA